MSLAAEGFPGDNDGTSPSGGEGKKRNKLGYHRTAVACGKHSLVVFSLT